MRIRFRFALAGSALAGAILIAASTLRSDLGAPLPGLVADLMLRFGEALVVAAFLAATVDLFVKERLTREVVREFSPAMIAHDLPRPLQEEVRNISLFEVFRESLEVEYRIEEMPGQNLVTLRTKVRYRHHNYADTPRKAWHLIEVQKPFAELAIADFDSIPSAGASNVFDEGGANANYDLRGVGDDSGGFRRWRHAVWINPSRRSGVPATFWHETLQVLPREYCDPYVSLHPTIGIKVTVSAPVGMLVDVTFAHRLAKRTTKVPPHDPRTWQLDVGFLPNEMFVLQWRPAGAAVAKET